MPWVFPSKRGQIRKGGKSILFDSKFEKPERLQLRNEKIPKFKRVCHNPLHESWSKCDEGRVVNLRARGLMSVANALQLFLEADLGKKS